MGQRPTKTKTQACPLVETLGCEECPYNAYEVGQNPDEHCQTESDFCAPMKVDAVNTYLGDLRGWNKSNQTIMEKLVVVANALENMEADEREKRDAATLAAEAAAKKEKYWNDAKRYFDDCGNALHNCNESVNWENETIARNQSQQPIIENEWMAEAQLDWNDAKEGRLNKLNKYYTACVQAEAEARNLCGENAENSETTCDLVWPLLVHENNMFHGSGYSIHNACMAALRRSREVLLDMENYGSRTDLDYIKSGRNIDYLLQCRGYVDNTRTPTQCRRLFYKPEKQ